MTKDELSSRFAAGLYLDNLYPLVKELLAIARSDSSPLPYYILAKILADLAADWEGRPVSVDEAQAFADFLPAAAQQVLQSANQRTSADALLETLNHLVRRFLDTQAASQ